MEFLALYKSILHFRQYLLGRKFTVYTDHSALQFMKKTTHENTKFVRWNLQLQEFGFEVKFLKGELNFADGLSRDVGIYSKKKKGIPNLTRMI